MTIEKIYVMRAGYTTELTLDQVKEGLTARGFEFKDSWTMPEIKKHIIESYNKSGFEVEIQETRFEEKTLPAFNSEVKEQETLSLIDWDKEKATEIFDKVIANLPDLIPLNEDFEIDEDFKAEIIVTISNILKGE